MRNNRATGNNATVTKLTTSDNHIKGYGTRQLSEHPFEVSFGRGKFGAPGDPQTFNGLQVFADANGSSDPAEFFGEDWKRYCYPLHALANHLRENFPNDRDALVMAKEFEQFAAVDPDAWSPVDYWIEHASADLRRTARV
ncbi:hypothetical protein [Buttiauxella agrestis]|uniref:hypothetical protein n=1 Tax=Buttiauxella agrestis TaxID=82977 RepID=UPI00155FC70C|nr:hypothetical protein [Buttiauxella agrestis]BCG08774.1 hypothetical protein BADSM9389_14330 [Buttiauxella agrestis]